MNTPSRTCLRITAYHMRRRVAVPGSGCHGAAAARPVRRDARLDELAPGGDLTRGGVDEERGHARPGYGGGLRAVARRLRTFDARPPAPRRRRAHAPRLRHRRRRARRLGDRQRARAGRRRLPGAAPLGRPAVPDRGAAPRTMARKLASIRAFFRTLVEHGEMAANPADLLPAPKLPQTLPRTLKPADVAALLDRIPATTPLEQRDRALFELAYACGLRAEELVEPRPRLDRLRRRAGAGRGQGRQDALRARRRARAGRDRRLPGARAAGARAARARTRRCSSPSPAGGSRPPTSGAACACGRATPRPRPASIRTPSGTPSRPTCWRAARTCARSRRCSGHARISTTQVYTRVESARLRAAYAQSHPRA